MHVKNTEKNGFVKKKWRAKLALFVHVLTQYDETVKTLTLTIVTFSYPMAESKRSRLVCERSLVQFPDLAKKSMFAFLFCKNSWDRL